MKNYLQTAAYLILAMIFFISCGAPQNIDNSKEARAGIEAANAKWMAAFDQGDAAGIAANYTEDTQVMPPNSETLRGRTAVQEVFQGFIDAGLKVKLTTVEVVGRGDMAFEVGNATVIGPDGQTLDQSKYIVVWKMVGSEWKMYRDIWNSNSPLPESGARESNDGEAI